MVTKEKKLPFVLSMTIYDMITYVGVLTGLAKGKNAVTANKKQNKNKKNKPKICMYFKHILKTRNMQFKYIYAHLHTPTSTNTYTHNAPFSFI